MGAKKPLFNNAIMNEILAFVHNMAAFGNEVQITLVFFVF